MSTFVPLTSASRVGQYLSPDLNPGYIGVRLGSKFAWEVRPLAEEDVNYRTPTAEVLSGKEAGSFVTRVAANQRAVLRLGFIYPSRYQALIAINPAFNELGIVQYPTIIEPKEAGGGALNLVITANREIDLANFKWFCRAYLTE